MKDRIKKKAFEEGIEYIGQEYKGRTIEFILSNNLEVLTVYINGDIELGLEGIILDEYKEYNEFYQDFGPFESIKLKKVLDLLINTL